MLYNPTLLFGHLYIPTLCSSSRPILLWRWSRSTPIILHLSIKFILRLLRSTISASLVTSVPTTTSSLTPLSSRTRTAAISSSRKRTARTTSLAGDIAINIAWRRTSDIGVSDGRFGTRSATKTSDTVFEWTRRACCRVEWITATGGGTRRNRDQADRLTWLQSEMVNS